MIQKYDILWNQEYRNDGYLYFAQRIVEMLDHKTDDIYRVPLLNTIGLIKEYIYIDQGPASKYNLEHIFAEFKKSFSCDIVIQYGWGQEKISEVISYLNATPSQRLSIMQYLKDVLDPIYLKWSLSLTEEYVPKWKEKAKIEKIIRCLLPELFSKGYAREEVFTFTVDTFFTDDIDPIIALKNFIAFYDCNEKEYTVYIGVKKTLSMFNEILVDRLSFSLADDGKFNEVQVPDNYYIVAKNEVKAIDATSAAKTVYKNLELFTSLYLFFCNNSTNLVLDRVYVVDQNSKGHTIKAHTRRLNSFTTLDDRSSAGNIAEGIITSLYRHSRNVVPDVVQIAKMHNRALDYIGIENGFLNLWSLLEMICVSRPKESHIDQIVEVIIPVLQYNYYSSIIADLNQNLYSILGDESYDKFLSLVDLGQTKHEKLSYIIFLHEYEPILNDLTDNLQNYPVIRSRLLNLHDRYKTKMELFEVSEIYAERVKWHIYRIYRARNALTHTGKTPSNLKDLGEHLHSYVDDLILSLIYRLSFSRLNSLSSAIIDCELNFKSIRNIFSKREPPDQASLDLLCQIAANIYHENAS